MLLEANMANAVDCPVCHGSGMVGASSCTRCRGTGSIRANADIEAGAHDDAAAEALIQRVEPRRAKVHQGPPGKLSSAGRKTGKGLNFKR
jgi:DnaJ-class molecular chaperone